MLDQRDPLAVVFLLAVVMFGLGAFFSLVQWLKDRRVVTNRTGRGLHLLPTTINTGVVTQRQEDIDVVMQRISGPQPEQKAGDLEEKSIANWKKIPAWRRGECVRHLQRAITASRDGETLLKKWAEQKAKGLRIGHDEFAFHFVTGMWVRNTLRQVVKDDYLPLVKYDNGEHYQNWDDAYYGAIDELAGAVVAA